MRLPEVVPMDQMFSLVPVSQVATPLALQDEPALGAAKPQPPLEPISIEHKLGFSPWITSEGLSQAAWDLIDDLASADNDGHSPERYQLALLRDLAENPIDDNAAVLFHNTMNRAFHRRLSDLATGRVDPQKVQNRWDGRTQPIDSQGYFELLSRDEITIRQLFGFMQERNWLLRNARVGLKQYQAIAAVGGWAPISDGEKLELGVVSPRVSELRERLIMSGDIVTASAPDSDSSLFQNTKDSQSQLQLAENETYDPQLLAAVQRFQRRHGLEDDGVVGSATLAALNVPVAQRIQQLETNLERMRWLPDDMGERHILTNLAEYRLRVIEYGNTVLQMPVIIGKPKHQTPVFADELEYLVVNPTWTVPESIARNELLPREMDNPGYLASRGFEVLKSTAAGLKPVDADSVENWSPASFPYRLRQRPGNNNALGKVKFMMPNPYSVYLHDTPSRGLFKNTRRAYSHGCVRLGEPQALANYLLESEGWTTASVNALFDSQQRKSVKLKRKVQNYLTYLTAFVDENLVVQFRPDIYRQDEPLRTALEREQAAVLRSIEGTTPLVIASQE